MNTPAYWKVWTLLPFLIALLPLARGQSAHAAPSPIQMEQSTSTASLRGIHSVGGGVAWASGAHGTVLRTEDSGFEWQSCAMPPGADKLDFRGVWAWDAMTAIVMSSGPAEESRLYKTTDGCVTWKLLLTNQDKEGFWDAIAFSDTKNGYLLGDPVAGGIVLMRTEDGGMHWALISSPDLKVPGARIGFFAASNSAMSLYGRKPSLGGPPWLGTGSAQTSDGKWIGPFVLTGALDCTAQSTPDDCMDHFEFEKHAVPLAQGNDASGVFSIAFGPDRSSLASGAARSLNRPAVAVGGNYQKPGETTGTAAWSLDGGEHWTVASKLPHGYRSAVAWDETDHAWVTAGPNGSDYSRDDGKTWQPLDNGNWNAISLPFLVGPGGRIGKLVSLPVGSQKPR